MYATSSWITTWQHINNVSWCVGCGISLPPRDRHDANYDRPCWQHDLWMNITGSYKTMGTVLGSCVKQSPTFSFKLHPYPNHAHQQRPMPTHAIQIAPMYSKIVWCVLPAYTKSWLDRTNKRSFTIVGFSSERLLVSVFHAFEKSDSNLELDAGMGLR